MFLIKSLDDLIKVSGATLEGTVARVAQLEADEHGVSTTFLDVAGDGGGEGGGGCRALWWEPLLAKLVSAEDSLGNILFWWCWTHVHRNRGLCSQVTGRALGYGGRGVSCLLETWGWRLLITGTGDWAGLVTVAEWSAVFDLITHCFFIFCN